MSQDEQRIIGTWGSIELCWDGYVHENGCRQEKVGESRLVGAAGARETFFCGGEESFGYFYFSHRWGRSVRVREAGIELVGSEAPDSSRLVVAG